MYEFSSKTKVAQKFKLSELLKIVHADKVLKQEAGNIGSVQMTNAISQATTGLAPSDEVNEIYIIEILLKNEVVPINFIKTLDKTIQFQVLYKIVCNDKVKWLSGPKTITDDKVSQSKHFETDWQTDEIQDLPLVSNLTDLYKEILMQIIDIKFRPNEKIKDYVLRLDLIKKQKSEIEKLTRIMMAEKQPNIKMEMNDKIKKMKCELNEKY